MKREEAVAELRRVFTRADVAGGNWLGELGEFDEVPLYSRINEVAFLEEFPWQERLDMLLLATLTVMQEVAEVADRLPRAEEYFLCATLRDWREAQECERAVPTPAILVSPNWTHEIEATGWFAPESDAAIEVMAWCRRSAEREEFVVAEDAAATGPDNVPRVYIGYRHGKHRFRSVGDFLVSAR